MLLQFECNCCVFFFPVSLICRWPDIVRISHNKKYFCIESIKTLDTIQFEMVSTWRMFLFYFVYLVSFKFSQSISLIWTNLVLITILATYRAICPIKLSIRNCRLFKAWLSKSRININFECFGNFTLSLINCAVLISCQTTRLWCVGDWNHEKKEERKRKTLFPFCSWSCGIKLIVFFRWLQIFRK